MRSITIKRLLFLLALVAVTSTSIPADGPPAVRPLKMEGKIVCVGDSITAGEGVKPAESYVGLFKSKAAAENLKLEVVNEGRSGWTIAGYVGAREKVVKAMPADATIVTIMLGTNDSRDEGTPAEVGKKAAADLEKLIDIYRQKVPDAQFVIVGPPRIYVEILSQRLVEAHYGEKSSANLTAITAALKDVATKRGLLFIDLSGLPSSKENSIDGVHPNAAGHQEMFDELWKAMAGQGPTTRPN